MEEQKYFVSYVAYASGNNKDFFNDIVYIDEAITSELLSKMQEDLVDRVNYGHSTYFAAQIIGLNKI
jgi:hypothetical protein